MSLLAPSAGKVASPHTAALLARSKYTYGLHAEMAVAA